MNWLRALYAEQTTPDEIVVFLLLGTFITLLIAFTIYAVVLIMLSRWRIEQHVSVWTLLFPPLSRIRKYTAEYVMSTLTALLLTLSVSVKHHHVDQVLAQDISLVGQDLVSTVIAPQGLLEAELIDTTDLNTSSKKLISWLSNESSQKAGVSAELLIRPLLAQGMNERANILVQAAVRKFADSGGSIRNTEILEKVLIVVSVTLLIGYAIWFGRLRWKEIVEHGASEPNYTDIIKKLALPAICIPLLLLSAVALNDNNRIVKSAVAKARAIEQQRFSQSPSSQPTLNSTVTYLFEKSKSRGINNEKVLLENISLIKRDIARLDTQISQTPVQIKILDKRLVGTERELAALNKTASNSITEHRQINESMTNLEQSIAALRRDLGSLQANQRSLQANQSRYQQALDRYQATASKANQMISQNERSAKNAITKANSIDRANQAHNTKHDRDIRKINKRLANLDERAHSHASSQVQ